MVTISGDYNGGTDEKQQLSCMMIIAPSSFPAPAKSVFESGRCRVIDHCCVRMLGQILSLDHFHQQLFNSSWWFCNVSHQSCSCFVVSNSGVIVSVCSLVRSNGGKLSGCNSRRAQPLHFRRGVPHCSLTGFSFIICFNLALYSNTSQVRGDKQSRDF